MSGPEHLPPTADDDAVPASQARALARAERWSVEDPDPMHREALRAELDAALADPYIICFAIDTSTRPIPIPASPPTYRIVVFSSKLFSTGALSPLSLLSWSIFVISYAR